MYLKIINKILLLLLFLCYYSSYAQEYSDREIGFDKETVRKSLLEENNDLNIENIQKELDIVRASLVKNYQTYLTYTKSNPWVSIPLSGCTNMGFDNNTLGWALYWRNGNYNQNNLLSDSQGALSTMSVLGSQTLVSVEEVLPNITGNRFLIVPGNSTDIVIPGSIKSATSTDNILRLGLPSARYVGREEVAKSFSITAANSLFQYSYAVVLNDDGNHQETSNPYFQVNIKIRNNQGSVSLPACATLRYDAYTAGNNSFILSSVIPSSNTGGRYLYKPWNTNTIDLSQYVDLTTNPIVTVSFSISDCNANGNNHEAWAYVEANCLPAADAIDIEGEICINQLLQFSIPNSDVIQGSTQLWTIINTQTGQETPYIGSTASHIFSEVGIYDIKHTITNPGACSFSYVRRIVVGLCKDCIDCTSFALIKNEKYLISGWVKESEVDSDNEQLKNFEKSSIAVSFFDVGGALIGQANNFFTSGDIIEGWQRIVGEFTVPQNIDNLKIDLNNLDTSRISYFDDIRVLPSKGSMKSFVYDKITQRLMAELDENNYGTFYEYDQEGGLIRVKKETEKGIYTIQETRSSNVKSAN